MFINNIIITYTTFFQSKIRVLLYNTKVQMRVSFVDRCCLSPWGHFWCFSHCFISSHWRFSSSPSWRRQVQQITLQNYLIIRSNNVHMSEIMNAYFILCMIQSWWVWDGTEHSDLWYNCRFDNETEAWFCASSEDTGKTIHLST